MELTERVSGEPSLQQALGSELSGIVSLSLHSSFRIKKTNSESTADVPDCTVSQELGWQKSRLLTFRTDPGTVLLASTPTCCVTREKVLPSPNLTLLTYKVGAAMPSSEAGYRTLWRMV